MRDGAGVQAEVRAHYEVEKGLATRLRQATREERLRLYNEVYDELFRLVPNHPQLTRKVDPRASAIEVGRRFSLLKRFLRPDITYLEIGAGDCSLAFEVARHVGKAYGLEVSEEISRESAPPSNFDLIISDGLSIPLPSESVQLAFSNQLMEHLHPDDAFEQLRSIHRVLARNGNYLCVTPNRLCGPHDISMYFDQEATGLHLKEYTNRELTGLFEKAGFTRVRAMIAYQGTVLLPLVPVAPILWIESMLERLPRSIRRRAGLLLIAVKLVASK